MLKKVITERYGVAVSRSNEDDYLKGLKGFSIWWGLMQIWENWELERYEPTVSLSFVGDGRQVEAEVVEVCNKLWRNNFASTTTIFTWRLLLN